MRSNRYLRSFGVIVPLFICLSLAAQTSSPSASAVSGKDVNRPIPFHGMISAVDQKNKTFTINGKQATRLFKVTDKTSIMKGAGAATMKDVVVNEEVSGMYSKNADGSFEAKIVKLGPMDKKATSPALKPSATPNT